MTLERNHNLAASVAALAFWDCMLCVVPYFFPMSALFVGQTVVVATSNQRNCSPNRKNTFSILSDCSNANALLLEPVNSELMDVFFGSNCDAKSNPQDICVPLLNVECIPISFYLAIIPIASDLIASLTITNREQFNSGLIAHLECIVSNNQFLNYRTTRGSFVEFITKSIAVDAADILVDLPQISKALADAVSVVPCDTFVSIDNTLTSFHGERTATVKASFKNTVDSAVYLKVLRERIKQELQEIMRRSLLSDFAIYSAAGVVGVAGLGWMAAQAVTASSSVVAVSSPTLASVAVSSVRVTVSGPAGVILAGSLIANRVYNYDKRQVIQEVCTNITNHICSADSIPQLHKAVHTALSSLLVNKDNYNPDTSCDNEDQGEDVPDPSEDERALIWIDKNINNNENKAYATKLAAFCPNMKTFDNACDGVSFLMAKPFCRFTLLMSGSIAHEVLAAVTNLQLDVDAGPSVRSWALENIIVFCMDASRYEKLLHDQIVDKIFVTIEPLIEHISSIFPKNMNSWFWGIFTEENRNEKLVSDRSCCFITTSQWETQLRRAQEGILCEALMRIDVGATIEKTVRCFIRLRKNLQPAMPVNLETDILQIFRMLTIQLERNDQVSLSNAAKKVLWLYTREDAQFYTVINKALRAAKRGHELLKLTKLVKLVMEGMFALRCNTQFSIPLSFAPEGTIVDLFRCVILSLHKINEFQNLQEHDCFYFRDLCSTSCSCESAQKFWENSRIAEDNVLVMFVIKFDRNLPEEVADTVAPIYLESITAVKKEFEVLFPPFTLFGCESVVKKVANTRIIVPGTIWKAESICCVPQPYYEITLVVHQLPMPLHNIVQTLLL